MGANSTNVYDFIIVGAGPSGLALAARLSATSSSPRVLLLEAGGPNDNAEYLVPAERFTLFASQPTLNWGYKTEPQTHLAGQEIDYSRGKGIGGSTAINFSGWVVGGAEDYDLWAEKVKDDTWSWRAVKERLKKIESYHDKIPEEHRKYVNPRPEDHGTTGPIDLSYADVWEKGLTDVFIAAEQTGLSLNPDTNSGNPIGMGLGPSTMYAGHRTTAKSYLDIAGRNFEAKTYAPISKVLFDKDKKAIGVRTIEGEEYFANKDVILSAGALNSPQLLMLSGIGPKDELEKHGIPVVRELENVGKNMQDHAFSTSTLLLKEGYNDRMAFEMDEEMKRTAKEGYLKDRSGKLVELYCGVPMGWFKSEAVYNSKEFKGLSEEKKQFMLMDNVPSFELATHVPPLFTGTHVLQKSDSYLTACTFVMNPQSTGTVTLRSSSPDDAPVIDPQLLSHPFDRRVMIEGYRKTLEFLSAPVFRDNTVKKIGVPKGDSDEEIWDHCRNVLFSSWHMCSTVRMGIDERESCVDREFRIWGVKGLRVVDLSVIPLLPNNHTQSTAYLVGETAAEKMIKEYGLDS